MALFSHQKVLHVRRIEKYSEMKQLSISHFEDEKLSVFFVICHSKQQLSGLRSFHPAICCHCLTLLSLPFQFQHALYLTK